MTNFNALVDLVSYIRKDRDRVASSSSSVATHPIIILYITNGDDDDVLCRMGRWEFASEMRGDDDTKK